MAYEVPGQMVTLEASTDLSGKQWHFVTADANGKAALASAGASAMGVLQNKPTSGQAATVMINGISKAYVTAASTVGAGDLVSVSTAGGVEALAAGDYAVGRIVSGSSGSAGRIVSVAIEPVGTT